MDSTKSSPTSVTDAKVLKLADTTVQNFFNKPYLGPSSPAAVAVAATPKLSPSCWKHTPTTPQTEAKKKETLRQQINSRNRMSREELMRKKKTKTDPPSLINHKPPSNPYPKKGGGRKTKRRRKHKLRTRKKRKSRKKHRKKRSTRKR